MLAGSKANRTNPLDAYFTEKKISEFIDKILAKKNFSFEDFSYKGISFEKKYKSVNINFSNGNVGECVPLDLFGELTKIRRNLNSKTISFIQPSAEDELKYRKESVQTKFVVIFVPSILFFFFLFKGVLNGKSLVSLILTVPFLTLVCSIILFLLYWILYSIFLIPSSLIFLRTFWQKGQASK